MKALETVDRDVPDSHHAPPSRPKGTSAAAEGEHGPLKLTDIAASVGALAGLVVAPFAAVGFAYKFANMQALGVEMELGQQPAAQFATDSLSRSSTTGGCTAGPCWRPY